MKDEKLNYKIKNLKKARKEMKWKIWIVSKRKEIKEKKVKLKKKIKIKEM